MSNASKRKGTTYESECVDVLRTHGAPHAERRTLGGAHDRGDIAGVPGVVFECKAEAKLDLPGYLREAEKERGNDKADVAVVWIKKRGKTSALDGYMVMTPRDGLYLLRQAGYLQGEGA
jgi:hypothetical protein